MTSSPLWWILGLVAFAGEIALVAGLGSAVATLTGGGPVGAGAGILCALALIAFWGRWMSPRAPRRMPRVRRALVVVLLAAGVAALWWVEGSVRWVTVFAVLALVLAGTQLYLDDDPARVAPPAG